MFEVRANVCCAVIGALTRLAVAGAPPTGVPAIRCDAPTFDFGTNVSSATVEHEFLIANAGDKALAIENVHTGCGCTSSSLSGTNVPPGGEMRLGIKFRLAGRSGAQRRNIYVKSNDPRCRIFTLQLVGEVLPAQPGAPELVRVNMGKGGSFSVTPPAIAFGAIPREAAVTTSVEVVFSGANAGALATAVARDLPRVQVRLEPGGDATQRVTVTTLPPLPAGPMRGKIEIRTAHANAPAIMLPVTGMALGELLVFPKDVVVSGAAGGTNAVVRHVVIRSRSGKTFQLQGAAVDLPGAGVTWMAVGTNAFRLTLDGILPALVPGDGGALLQVATDCVGEERVVVPIRAAAP